MTTERKGIEIIVDIGSNWRLGSDKDSLKRAFALIDSAAANHANVVKFQLFRGELLVRDQKQARAMGRVELPLEWLRPLKERAEERGVEFLVTPFYLEAVDVLENLGVSRYKIASWDLTYTPLLEAVGATGKPVIMSTGAATLEEVEEAVITLRPDYDKVTPKDVTLLHCTGGYPTPAHDANLYRIIDLSAEFFPMPVGFSSHVIEPHVVAASALYSPSVIEVHYDLGDGLGAEAGHSLTPETLNKTLAMMVDVWKAQDCNCKESLSDFDGKLRYRRDPSDWLRPLKVEPELQ